MIHGCFSLKSSLPVELVSILNRRNVNKEVTADFSGVPGVPEKSQVFQPYEVKFYPVGPLPAPLVPLKEVAPEKRTYRRTVILRRDSSDYMAPDGMKWIWGEREKTIPCSKIHARKKFTVDAGATKSCLRVSVDDMVTRITLDGKELDIEGRIMNNYHYLNDLELTPVLTPGEHTVCIEAADAGQLPCGLLAEIRPEYVDGKVVSIPTNSSWETAPDEDGPWTPAVEIKKIGDRPWGMPMLLKTVQMNVKQSE